MDINTKFNIGDVVYSYYKTGEYFVIEECKIEKIITKSIKDFTRIEYKLDVIADSMDEMCIFNTKEDCRNYITKEHIK